MSAAVDTHTHLNHPRLRARIAEALSRARAAGVEQLIVVGYDLPSSREAVEIAEAHHGVWAAVGVHPHDAQHVNPETMDRLREMAASPAVVAVGETGLDFYRNLSPPQRQREVFAEHIQLARELSLPVIVHCRQAEEELLRTAEQEDGRGWIWHCFSGSADQALRAVELGLWIGFTGNITYKKADEIRRAVAAVPEERVLTETDCPYLAPEPRRSRDNEPANVIAVVDTLARLRGVTREEMARKTAHNARLAFGIEIGG